MFIVELINTELNAYQIINEDSFQLKEMDLDNVFSSKEGFVLILDYVNYYNPKLKVKIFDKYPALKRANLTLSPQEILGGYFRYHDHDLSKPLTVVTIELGCTYLWELVFDNRFYDFKEKNSLINQLIAFDLAKDVLKLSKEQFVEFEQFLYSTNSDGKAYGQIIQDVLSKYGAGQNSYDNFLEILDVPTWAHIRLQNLVEFRKQLLTLLGISNLTKQIIVGWLSYFFPLDTRALASISMKAQGALYLMNNAQNFYSINKNGVYIGVYCYPDWLKVPLYNPNSSYEIYSSPKVVELIDTGSITLFKGDSEIAIKTKNSLKKMKIEVNLDGNQNLYLVANDETHMIL